jgi:hypothetical protein
MAGVSVSREIMKLLPKWIAMTGLELAVAGELSWLHLDFCALRFPDSAGAVAGIYLVDRCGVTLPCTRMSKLQPAAASGRISTRWFFLLVLSP